MDGWMPTNSLSLSLLPPYLLPPYLLPPHLLSQGFSKSFQNMKNENTGLNTAITRSTVHKSLDPQFA